MSESNIRIRHIYISSDHNFNGRHGQEPGETPMTEVRSVDCVEGKGLDGDRYFGFKEDYKGQVTFFAHEVHEDLLAMFPEEERTPDVYRRNVITSGVDLNEFIGKEFEIQGVRFVGTEEAKPCYWMNTAFGPGAEEALRGRGGLRARILSSGKLSVDG